MTDDARKISVHFGALCPPIHEQLGVSPDCVEGEQLCADAIVRLSLRGVLSDSEVDRARQRLIKQIAKAVVNHG